MMMIMKRLTVSLMEEDRLEIEARNLVEEEISRPVEETLGVGANTEA